MPTLKQFNGDRVAFNKWYQTYRKQNAKKINAYKRKWNRANNKKKRLELIEWQKNNKREY